MNDGDILYSLGRLHEKTDHQTALLEQIDARVTRLERSRARQLLQWAKIAGALLVAFVTGKSWH